MALGQAFVCNGTNGHVTVASASLPALTTQHTITFWAKITSNVVADVAIIDNQWGNDTSGGWQFIVNNGVLLKGFTGNATGRDEVDCSASLTTTFHLVCLVRRASSLEIWVDNTLKNTNSSLSFGVLKPQTTLTFGGATGSANFVPCNLDDIRIYNYDLSSGDIGTLFNQGSLTTGLLARWKAEGNANDSVGSANGTASNITYTTGIVPEGGLVSQKLLLGVGV